jgi:hypothetical protein
LFWANAEAIQAFRSALRRIDIDRLGLLLGVGWITWDPAPGGSGLRDLLLSITDTRGRAPKSGDLADLAAALDRALRAGCETPADRRAA